MKLRLPVTHIECLPCKKQARQTLAIADRCCAKDVHNFHRGHMVVRAGRGTTLQAGCVGWEVGTRNSSSPELSCRGCYGRGTLRLGQPNLSRRGFGSKPMSNVQNSSDSLRIYCSYVRTCVLLPLCKNWDLLKFCDNYLFFSPITLKNRVYLII